MDAVTIIGVGTIATLALSAINTIVERLGLARSHVTRAIGSFVTPAAFSAAWSARIVQFMGGIIFTLLYNGVFQFLKPESITAFVKIGAGLGLGHGVLLSFFLLTDLESLETDQSGKRFELAGTVTNVFAHVIFGMIVGLGFGLRTMTASVLPLVTVGFVVAVALLGFIMAIEPTLKRRFFSHK